MTTTARMAPSWMITSKLSAFGPVNPRRWPARIRWPVEETGRNSVSPSTMPRMAAETMLSMGGSREWGYRCARAEMGARKKVERTGRKYRRRVTLQGPGSGVIGNRTQGAPMSTIMPTTNCSGRPWPGYAPPRRNPRIRSRPGGKGRRPVQSWPQGLGIPDQFLSEHPDGDVAFGA